MEIDYQRFKMIFTEGLVNRIKDDEGIGYIVDVHQLHSEETRRFLNNMINVVTEPCQITVIHGYNRGTVLSKMIRTELNNPKVVRIRTVAYNPGETFLEIA